MDALLRRIAVSQGAWSATSSKLKSTFERVRRLTLILSIIGALLATIASQTWGEARLALALLGAVLFGVVSFLTARCLGTAKAQEWVRARAASEALKRLAYTCAAGGIPYDDPATRDGAAAAALQEVEQQVVDLLGEQVGAGQGSTPASALSPPQYVSDRLQRQAQFYETHADACRRVVGRLRAAEFILALSTAVITAIAGVMTKSGFDFVALTAVLTTVSGAILAHIEASRYDFLVTTYRATARRLRDALLTEEATLQQPTPAWAGFVAACEAVIATETGSWVIKMGKA